MKSLRYPVALTTDRRQLRVAADGYDASWIGALVKQRPQSAVTSSWLLLERPDFPRFLSEFAAVWGGLLRQTINHVEAWAYKSLI